MKILHVIASLAMRHGGPSKACAEMARSLSELGHEVRIMTTDRAEGEGSGPPLAVGGAVEVLRFPVRGARFWAFSWPLARALREAVPRHDIVHIHGQYLFPTIYAARCCGSAGVPYVMSVHGALDPFIHSRHRTRKAVSELLFDHRVLRGCAGVHYITEEEKTLAEPFACGARGFVVPLGLYPEDYAALPPRGTFRARHPETEGRKIVLFLGRINFKKGFDILAEAFRRLLRENDDSHLVVAGPDSDGYEAEVRRLLAQAKVLHRTTFTGMILGADKLAAFADADVFVLPSYSENFGIAVVEALACGLPVVISDRVNLWREVAGAEAGIVTPCDAGLFAGALRRVLDDPVAARGMGERGHRLVEEQFRWPAVARALEREYMRIVSKDRAPHAI